MEVSARDLKAIVSEVENDVVSKAREQKPQITDSWSQLQSHRVTEMPPAEINLCWGRPHVLASG